MRSVTAWTASSGAKSTPMKARSIMVSSTTRAAHRISSRARANRMSVTLTMGKPISGRFMMIPSMVKRAMYMNAMAGTVPVANHSVALSP